MATGPGLLATRTTLTVTGLGLATGILTKDYGHEHAEYMAPGQEPDGGVDRSL